MIINKRSQLAKKGREAIKILTSLSKRERLIFSVIVLSLGFFIAEHLLGRSGIFTIFAIAILTDLLLFLSLYSDLKENTFLQIFILPFFFSLSFGLFYFLVPGRYLTRIFTTSLYAVGLYSLFLSENIFTVSSIRTIALLASARTVSFVITLISYFFLSNVLFSLHIQLIPFLIILFLFSFPLVVYSIWTYTLEKKLSQNIYWSWVLAFVLVEAGSILWFWPSTPTVLAIFLTGVFYTTVGLSQVWFEKRLFRSVMWEYIWVSGIVLITLLLFTSWTG